MQSILLLILILTHLFSFHPPISYSSPLAQEAHERHAGNKANEAQGRDQGRGVGQLAAEHPVPGPHLHDAYPDQDAGGKRVEGADGPQGGRVIAVERVEHADADRHADRGRDSECERHEELLRHRQRLPGCSGPSRSGLRR